MAEIKRPNYFTSEFLVEADFKDEQAYHREMRYRHNQSLHDWGVIGNGLLVNKTGDQQVTVTPGMAINNKGQEIILPSDPAPPSINLSGTGNVYVTIEYGEVKDEADKDTTSGVLNEYRRITERPLIKSTTSQPTNDGAVIWLATVTLDGNGNIVGNPDNTVRTLAGAKLVGSSVGTTELANGAITNPKIADNAVNAAKIADGSVGTAELADGAVTTNKLANNSVNAEKLADTLQVQGEGFQRLVYTETKSLGSYPVVYGIENFAQASTDAVDQYAQSVGIQTSAQASTPASTSANAQGFGIHNSSSASSKYNAYNHGIYNSSSASGDDTAVNYGVLSYSSASGDNTATNYGINNFSSASGDNYASNYGISNSSSASGDNVAGNYGIINYSSTSGDNTVTNYGVYSSSSASSSNTNASTQSYGLIAYSYAYSSQANPNVYSYGVYGSAYASGTNAKIYGVFATASGTGNIPLYVSGKAVVTGGVSAGHITDRFINASGQRLRTGDVIKLKGTPIPRFTGEDNKIPIVEVTLAEQENDTKIIGIVDGEAIPGPDVPDTRQEADDPTFIEDGGELYGVILGNYAHCKVDATEAPIEVGDLLTSSKNPGHAKKATDPKLGSIIGKALEPLAQGTGYIAVFVNIQ